VPDADAAFVGSLRSKIIERIEVKTFRRFSPRWVWGIAIVLVLLIIGLLVFSPQVVEAMRRLLGYIPGVGYVEQGPALRVLSAPVTVQKEGLTVTIERARRIRSALCFLPRSKDIHRNVIRPKMAYKHVRTCRNWYQQMERFRA